jgi:murein L,D-transpeptidase YafK
MAFLRVVMMVVFAGLVLASCAPPSKFRTYDGPPVTSVQVHKGDRVMYLLNGTDVLRSYDIALGFAPEGHKQFEGDGRTPEGTYYINRRNPNSAYHLSLGISYPNAQDMAFAAAAGRSPGGDIFIHGGPQQAPDKARERENPDWTWGCVSVTDREIEEIYAMIRDGTVVHILP